MRAATRPKRAVTSASVGGASGTKRGRASGSVIVVDEDPVRDESMEVRGELQRRPKALDERHRADVAARVVGSPKARARPRWNVNTARMKSVSAADKSRAL